VKCIYNCKNKYGVKKNNLVLGRGCFEVDRSYMLIENAVWGAWLFNQAPVQKDQMLRQKPADSFQINHFNCPPASTSRYLPGLTN
jgi:hypothetical protein